jgi:hypothetical protein
MSEGIDRSDYGLSETVFSSRLYRAQEGMVALAYMGQQTALDFILI